MKRLLFFVAIPMFSKAGGMGTSYNIELLYIYLLFILLVVLEQSIEKGISWLRHHPDFFRKLMDKMHLHSF